MANRAVNPVPQPADAAQDTLVEGKSYFFDSGTNNPLTTYADSLLTTANAHPVPHDAAGRLPNVFFEGSAKWRLTATINGAPDQLVWERDPVGSEAVTGEFALWNPLIIYNIPDIAKGSDAAFYISDANANQGNDPTTPSPTKWSEFRMMLIYNASKSYSIGEVVQESTGLLWRSVVNSNVGNTPNTDSGANWLPATQNLWIRKTTGFTVIPGKRYSVDASSGSVDAALPTSVQVGDIIQVHNESISSNTVRLTNTALTIKGPAGTVTTSDNLQLNPGDTADLIAVTATILEVV